MSTHRKAAIIVGVLFISAIVLLFVGQALYGPMLDSPDYLEDAYPGRTTVIIGVLLEFTGTVLAIALLPAFLYPVLKKHSEAWALGYFALRLLEVVLHAVDKLKKLSLVSLSQTYLDGGGMEASTLQAVGSSIQADSYWAFWLSIVVFAVGALVFYSVLYKSRLVPRWISGWGFAAAVLLLIGAVLPELGLFAGLTGVALELVFVLPIPLNEITLAIWLIVKGFNPSALAPQSAKEARM
jgi:hypothetical protein